MRGIVVIEDHHLMRDLLVERVSRHVGPTVEVRGVSPDALPVTADVAVIDLELGNASSPRENVRALVDRGCAVVVISASGDAMDVQWAIHEGALTFITKGTDLEDLGPALDAVLRGEPYVSADLAGKLASPRVPGVRLSPEASRALVLRAARMSTASVATSMGLTADAARALLREAIDAYRAAR